MLGRGKHGIGLTGWGEAWADSLFFLILFCPCGLIADRDDAMMMGLICACFSSFELHGDELVHNICGICRYIEAEGMVFEGCRFSMAWVRAGMI